MTYIPAQKVDYEQKDLLERILTTLKQITLHLQSMSGEEVTEEDTE